MTFDSRYYFSNGELLVEAGNHSRAFGRPIHWMKATDRTWEMEDGRWGRDPIEHEDKNDNEDEPKMGCNPEFVRRASFLWPFEIENARNAIVARAGPNEFHLR
jgi:hypothetical protein